MVGNGGELFEYSLFDELVSDDLEGKEMADFAVEFIFFEVIVGRVFGRRVFVGREGSGGFGVVEDALVLIGWLEVEFFLFVTKVIVY